ncbi:23S rRNA (pseudouridine(1915)-N(3))-methyltransferase RlmH [Criblamydia sequanensis]|uniref:Ribosomal RNA large subunit methyltransferase H n=1 Tax=Candidatus Criblamydia sequanensis CRIB-18 TaxID=1437425 RepID=A0A090CZ17_9BACT|nr:23S rRNA (pseudouridine(1915)-N(3))-methyltransferase RlmH [Criblamydia sequanensis]CDR33921.1 SPOUT methyltransferase [Criblamydia sequanensis CRIB-18]
MLKIKILSIGKTKETWLEEALSLYFKRLESQVIIETEWLKNDDLLEKAVLKEKFAIALDSTGPSMKSEEFASFLKKGFEEGGSRIAFVIGGATGLPLCIKNKYPLLSLSSLTLTHQMVRLLLVEQIYRSFEIWKGSGYHK